MNYPDLLLDADEVVASLDSDAIYAVTVRDSANPVLPNIMVQITGKPNGAHLIELAQRASIQGVQVTERTVGGNCYLTGKRGDVRVELFG